MKFGIDAPWYDDPVERTAFNLYAMEKVRETELLHAVADYLNSDIDLEDLRDEYNMTETEYWWFIDELKDRGIFE